MLTVDALILESDRKPPGFWDQRSFFQTLAVMLWTFHLVILLLLTALYTMSSLSLKPIICKCHVGSDRCEEKVAVCVKLETCCNEMFLLCTKGATELQARFQNIVWCRIIGLKRPNIFENFFWKWLKWIGSHCKHELVSWWYLLYQFQFAPSMNTLCLAKQVSEYFLGQTSAVWEPSQSDPPLPPLLDLQLTYSIKNICTQSSTYMSAPYQYFVKRPCHDTHPQN